MPLIRYYADNPTTKLGRCCTSTFKPPNISIQGTCFNVATTGTFNALM